ncbi:poly-beta-1,6-N-acetyl-D-glucosamine synthase [bacterium BMS3Abin07]|nr:poly-beta-1,6-N-acetyl-D-glucosamine synthase [bacterium BMS3Abin07]GBE32714.1 poly-beta-1,6-N-acetyl-D-glucosamine synthase [bacterium BMS3Bbin05]HDL20905.1 glycosyltransferase [Nitrospirota bacterium]HDO21806.1 glycosyltransferase [Nitrospirota bacterium]
MDHYISVIIPNHNGEGTIRQCLESAFSSQYDGFEVVVVDDGSTDGSVETIKKFPCKLIRLPERSGASMARNTGAQNSTGDILFFLDSDCVINEDTLGKINSAFNDTCLCVTARGQGGNNVIIGGTYSIAPYDKGFFNTFQSVFINYSETKKADNPDYIASHAMAIDAEAFRTSGGFNEDFLPIIEDVEFSHRLKKSGYRLIVIPGIEVGHIFNFSFVRSLGNAFRKSMYWTMYSLKNRDIFSDSGTASVELKINVFTYFLMLLLIVSWGISKQPVFLSLIPVTALANILLNRKLLIAYYRAKGMLFAFLSSIYYLFVYPVPVGLGAVAGMAGYLIKLKTQRH